MNGSQLIPVVHRPQPFSNDIKRYAVVEGVSVFEIVEQCAPSHFKQYGIVCINGQMVPRDMWHYVRPKIRNREVVVTLHLSLHGEGASDIIKLVATIAVIAVATLVTGGALGGILGASFASGGLGALLGGAAISIGGLLAVNALIPPPSTKLPTSLGTTQQASLAAASAESGKGAASLSGNLIGANVTLPRVIGTMRLFPPFICEPLVEPVQDLQYAEVIMALAGWHSIEDIKVGDVFADDIPELEYEICDPGTQPTLVTRYARTIQVGLTVSQHDVLAEDHPDKLVDQATPTNSLPRWHRVVTRESPDEFWIPLALTEGLYDASDTTAKHGFPIRTRIRLLGSSTWINLPEVHYATRIIKPVIPTLRLMFRASVGAMPEPPSNGFIVAYTVAPVQNIAPAPIMGGYTADEYFTQGGSPPGDDYLDDTNEGSSDVSNVWLSTDRAEFWLDPATFPLGVYEVEIIQGMLYADANFVHSSYQLSGDVVDLFGYRKSSGDAVTHEPVWDRHYKITVPSVSSVWNSSPVMADDVTSIALKVYSRQLSSITVLASGLVPDYGANTSDGWGGLVATSNPAPHFRDVLIGQNNFDPLPYFPPSPGYEFSLLNNDEILEWRDYCLANGYECNAVVDGQPAFQVAQMIASCGFAQPRQCESWGVMIDRPRDDYPVVQVFSFRNLGSFRWEKSFNRRPSGFRVSFIDSTLDYTDNEITVLDPDGDQGDRLENIRYEGLVTEAEATRRATFDLVQSRLRSTFYFGSANIQNIVARRGDLVGVQHDIIDHVAGSAYIKEILREDPLNPTFITGFILDGTIPKSNAEEIAVGSFLVGGGFSAYGELPYGDSYEDPSGSPGLGEEQETQYRVGVAVRTNSAGMERTLTFEGYITEEESDEVTLYDSYNDAAGLIQVGQLLTSGVFGTEFKRLYLFSIQPKADLNADLVFVDEAPEVWAALD